MNGPAGVDVTPAPARVVPVTAIPGVGPWGLLVLASLLAAALAWGLRRPGSQPARSRDYPSNEHQSIWIYGMVRPASISSVM